MYENTPNTKLFFNKTNLEKDIVPWEEDKLCYLCWKKKKDTCRLCGNSICNRCARDIPLKEIKNHLLWNIIVCKDLCFKEVINSKKNFKN